MLKKYGYWLGLLGGLVACQPQSDSGAGQAAATPPTGHFTGTLTAVGSPELRVSVDVRHPRPGYYDAELLAAATPDLSFVGDELAFKNDTLHLERPGRPDEVLTLRRQGDFWRGTLMAGASQYTLLLVRRGPPEPIIYRVQRLHLSPQTALQFSPADESLLGPGMLLLPDSAHEARAAVWADGLARQGVAAQFQLPLYQERSPDTVHAGYLRRYLGYLRGGRGVDTAQVGLWLAGQVAAALPPALADTAERLPTLAFAVLVHPPLVPPRSRAAWRQVSQRVPLLALYSPAEATAAASMRAALGKSSTSQVLSRYPPTPAGDQQMQADVLAWLRKLAARK